MKLYYSPGTCAMAAHIVVMETGLPVETEKVDLGTKKTASGQDYWQINPKGYVPALVLDNGDVLTEASIVCQYLADQKPDSGLAPAMGSMERYHFMEALNFASAEVHKQVGALFNPALTPDMRQVQMATISKRFDALEKLLSGKSFVMGERFTAADAYLFTVLNWTHIHKIELDKWPNIKAYIERVAARPKVRETMAAEGLLK